MRLTCQNLPYVIRHLLVWCGHQQPRKHKVTQGCIYLCVTQRVSEFSEYTTCITIRIHLENDFCICTLFHKISCILEIYAFTYILIVVCLLYLYICIELEFITKRTFTFTCVPLPYCSPDLKF